MGVGGDGVRPLLLEWGQQPRQGPRRRIPQDILQRRSAELVVEHEKVMKYNRHEHVAHRVGSSEDVASDALREDPDGPVFGLQVLVARMLLPEDHIDLRRLAEDLLACLQPVLQAEQDALLGKLS
jgi:hypothetical protein